MDKCWLNDDVIDMASSLKFCVHKITNEDKVSINLRLEIVDYFKATLVDSPDGADVILTIDEEAPHEGFQINCQEQVKIVSASTTGLFYGFYAYIQQRYYGRLPEYQENIPSQNIRMLDQWDNFDGTIERGYAGRSIFYENNHFRGDNARIRAYARLMASVGLNAISLNNVNVHEKETFFIDGEALQRVADIAEIFESFGITVYLSVNFAAPLRFGDLETADPFVDAVHTWWQDRVRKIYDIIPNFGGFVVKADSEGQPGPFYYGRNHADGANMLAKALEPYGGTVIWRAFVYDSQQDWRDRSIDRAKAAYDNFVPLDGKFAKNVILQVKFGPIDFQPREPVQALFGQMTQTNMIIEFQVTQEYTGHQIDTNFLATQWAQTLSFDVHPSEGSLLLRDVPKTLSKYSQNSGIAAVSSIGRDENWTGNKLSQANLYAFGRLAWQSDLSDTQILNEWVPLTFKNAAVQKIVTEIMCTSNKVYADYTAPLGIGFMVKSAFHYGPGVNDYEYDRWGTYHFADRNGLGVDRTLNSGTGYTRQYTDENYELYENLKTCPDEFLLFFHHVNYDYVLHDGRTVIQYIYDTHFSGYDAVDRYKQLWDTVEGQLPQTDFLNIKERLERQLKNAREWRDQVNTFFYRMSGVPDAQGRKIYK